MENGFGTDCPTDTESRPFLRLIRRAAFGYNGARAFLCFAKKDKAKN